MNKTLLRVGSVLFMITVATSCQWMEDMNNSYSRIYFRNNSDNPLLLLFDYNTSDGTPSVPYGDYLLDTVRDNSGTYVITNTYDSWNKHIKDSLHLYLIKDTIWSDYFSKNPRASVYTFVEESLTDEYLQQFLVARMTLTIEDLWGKGQSAEYPIKRIVFPPKDNSHYNTIYYNSSQ